MDVVRIVAVSGLYEEITSLRVAAEARRLLLLLELRDASAHKERRYNAHVHFSVPKML